MWPDDVDEVLAGDLTVAGAYVTPAGGAVVTGVAPCGLRDQAAGTVGFTTSLGFGKKLERIVAAPKVALAYHTREHGFASSSLLVLVQGKATVQLSPSRERLTGFRPSAERFLGPAREGPIWTPLLREYYEERVFVDIAATQVTVWPDLAASGTPRRYSAGAGAGAGVAAISPRPPRPQRAPKNGTGPRVDVDRVAGQLAGLPHRLVAYKGADGMPVVVPVSWAGHGPEGIRVVAPAGLLPPGGRRAGLLAHSFRPQLIGLSTRTLTGWLDVADDGTAVYAPHTSKGFWAPPRKDLLLVSNGLFAKYGMRQARRSGLAERLARLGAESGAVH